MLSRGPLVVIRDPGNRDSMLQCTTVTFLHTSGIDVGR